MRTRLSALAMMLVAAGVAACAGQPGGGEGSADGSSAPPDRWTACPSLDYSRPPPADLPPPVRLTDDFVATSAVVCDLRNEPTGGGGENLVLVEGRTREITALVAALRLPDRSRTNDACDLAGVVVRWFALLDAAGRWIRPQLPDDECGKPRREVLDALSVLPVSTVATRFVRQITSDAAAAAGCSQVASDAVAVATLPNGAGRPGPAVNPLARAERLRLCVYRVPASEQGSPKPGGDFVSGGVLDRERRAAIEASLGAAGPARPCSTQAGRFALILAAEGTGEPISVELDGCQRILIRTEDSGKTVETLAQADATLIGLLSNG